MVREDSRADNLAQLRKESLQTVLLCMAAVLYIWYLVLFQPVNRVGPAGWGPVLLAGGLAAAFLLQYHSLSWASAAAILGLAAAILYNMWLTNMVVLPYLLTVVVSLTGLLLGIKAVVWVTGLCIGSVFVIDFLRWGYSPLSIEPLSSAVIIGVVGILSSLAVRNLYLTIDWALDQTMVAQRNQEELRNRRGELVRTLKALDEAYQRLEYLNYDLERAREAAEKARLTKQRFVTSVSHELRTPLNVILALSEMMYLSPESYGGIPLPAEYRGDVREIYRNSKYLLNLIDDVLDMSQIEAERMRIEMKPCDLRDVVIEAIDMIRPLVEEKKIALHAELPTDLPSVLIDRARVQQVLLNLLNNARRFTEQGSITVRVTLEGEWIRVTVADTGIGIPPGEHENIFKEFHQIEGSIAGHHNGSGLGLAISKRLVSMHGGHIWVESDGVPGQGSRFHFTLPLAGASSVEVSTVRESRMPLKPPTSRGRTLLLVDGDATLVKMLERELEEYRVVPVDNLSDVPTLINELQVRAAVFNLAQRSRAWQQMQQLRQRLGQSSLPIILCPLVGERQLGEFLGVMDYLVKPITRDTLQNLLDRLGGSVRRVLVIDDDPRMARVLSRMLRATVREVEVICVYNGQDGLREMRSQHPDLVLLDLIMPEMDGYSVLTQMQEDAELRRIPVAVITARARAPEEERQLGGKMLCVFTEVGFTNEEVLNYLRGILNAIGARSPL